MSAAFTTLHSDTQATFASGMVRDAEDGKPRFDLLLPEGVPYEEQFLTRCAALLARGAAHYGDRNWELADGDEEAERFRSSALRHVMQWAAGDRTEDHAAATVFNLLAAETLAYRRTQDRAASMARHPSSQPAAEAPVKTAGELRREALFERDGVRPLCAWSELPADAREAWEHDAAKAGQA